MRLPAVKMGVITLNFKERFQYMFMAIWTFYSVFYVLFGACETNYEYNLGKYMKYVQVLTCLMLAVLACFMTEMTVRRIVISVLTVVLSTLILLSNSSFGFLLIMMFILLAQFVDFHKLIQFDIKLKTFLLICVLLLCLLGIVPNRSGYYGAEEYGSFKMALGFTHPNVLGYYCYGILCEWLYLRIKKMHLIEYILVCGFVVALDFICRSRTTEFAFIGVLVLYGILRLRSGIIYSKIVHFILVISVPIIMGCSYLFAFMYGEGNEAMQELNSAMSGRIGLSWRFLDYYNQTLFGQEIKTSSRGSTGTVGILDNQYVRMGLAYGLVLLIVFCLAYMFVVHVLLKQKKGELALLCLFWIWVGFGESVSFNIFYNVTLMALVAASDYKNTLPRFRRRVKAT